MAAPKPLPDLGYLQQCFSYNPETGELRWKERPESHFTHEFSRRSHNTTHAGRTCEVNSNGRVTARINRRLYLGHRIIWKLMTGEEPPMIIDHRNNDPTDNRWDNLRAATASQSVMNTRSHKGAKRTSQYKGVYWHLGAWEADVRAGGTRHYLGRFKTETEAADARLKAALRLHGEFIHR